MSIDIRVLHVDDEPDFLELTSTYLRRYDERFCVDTARDTSEGLERLDDADFDCIVSDYDMPERDGIEFLQAVRREYPDLPFILFTGKGSEEVASDAISAGVTEYLQKRDISEQYELLANRIQNVVDAYRSRQSLAERTRRLETLIDNVPGIVYRASTDPEWPMELVNGKCEELTGYPASALESGRVSWGEDIFHPEDVEPAREEIRDAIEDGDSFEVTYRIVTADGATKWVQERGQRVRTAVEERPVFEGLITDITERKRRQEELRRQQAESKRFRELLEQALIATDTYAYEWDLETDDISRQPTTEPLLGMTDGEVGDVFEGFLERVHPDDRRRVEETLREAAESGTGFQYECRIRTDDGSWRWFRDRGDVRTDADGEPMRAVGTLTDVTDQKERERELSRYKAFVENSSDVISVLTADGVCRYVSPTIRDVLGHDPDAVVGEDGEDYVHPEDRPAIDDVLERAQEHPDEIETVEYRYRHADGSWRWLESTAVNRLDDPEIDGILFVSRDVTERKEQEQELRRKTERLDRFASIVSHDLRTPLQIASGRLALAREEHDSEHLADVETAHERMESLIEQLLTLAREGTDDVDTEPIDLARMAEQCWTEVPTADATLEMATEVTVLANRLRMRQVLENLFRNAVEHGGEAVTVTVGELDDGFYVEDDGVGISEAHHRDVLEMGYSTRRNSTGLGLSIVHHVAQAHGWDVTVTDGSEGGARIEITGVESFAD